MARLRALSKAELLESSGELAYLLDTLETLPNSLAIMAHRPEIVAALLQVWKAIMFAGTVPAYLKYLAGHVASRAAGCQYCTAHTAQFAHLQGAELEKLDAVWDYETSPLFSDAERAVLSLAVCAGQSPNMVEDAHFEEMHRHFPEAEIVEIMAAISVYGFMNRWNDSFATPLEANALEFGEAHLRKHGWTPGSHAIA